jgi:DNA excision repair protein ERCC-1
MFPECSLNVQVARYLEVFKSYENKPADLIQERVEHDYISRLTGILLLLLLLFEL